MATNKKEEVESMDQELKHLGFVRFAAIQAFVCVSNLYAYAKDNSGPLRSAVGTVEGTVTTVLGPVYNKFKTVPDDVLFFVDNKVDEATKKFDEHAPAFAKQIAGQSKDLIQTATYKAVEVVDEARSAGPKAAVHHVATESKQFLIVNSVKLWNGLDHYPPLHAVAEMAVPTAAHWSQKYNHVIKEMTGKGYAIFGYLPLIPTNEIAKAFKHGEASMTGDKAASAGQRTESTESDSD